MTTRVAKLLEAVTDPSTKAAHSELCFKYAKEAAHNAMRLAPFVVSDSEAITLERMGITTSPFATNPHTHAGDKIIENDCLAIIGHHLPKEPVTFIQLKKGKLHLLNRAPKQDFLANYCHEPKDVLRYGITNPSYCPKVDTQFAVIADTLHFMSTRQLTQLFLCNPNLQTLFATLVLPIEALHRLPSLFPDIYRLEYYSKHFAYMPGGHGGGAYVHSYETLKWLSTGQIGKSHINPRLGTTDYLSIEKIETKAAHHIMLITRRQAQSPWPLSPLWVFHPSDYVRLPHVFYPPEANVQNTYPHDLIKRMQAYCFSVKAVSLRDIFAKLRQVIETAELKRYSMADLIRLANYLLLITGMEQVSDYECLLTKGWVSKLSCRIRIRVRQLFESLRGKTSYAALLSVTDVVPVPFTTTPCIRGCDGISWLPEPDEADQPQNDDPGPSLEDLEMMADLHTAERLINNETAANPKNPQTNGKDSNPKTSQPSSTPPAGGVKTKTPTTPPNKPSPFPEHPKDTPGGQPSGARADTTPTTPRPNPAATRDRSRRPPPNAWTHTEGWDEFTHPATSDSEYDFDDTSSVSTSEFWRPDDPGEERSGSNHFENNSRRNFPGNHEIDSRGKRPMDSGGPAASQDDASCSYSPTDKPEFQNTPPKTSESRNKEDTADNPSLTFGTINPDMPHPSPPHPAATAPRAGPTFSGQAARSIPKHNYDTITFGSFNTSPSAPSSGVAAVEPQSRADNDQTHPLAHEAINPAPNLQPTSQPQHHPPTFVSPSPEKAGNYQCPEPSRSTNPMETSTSGSRTTDTSLPELDADMFEADHNPETEFQNADPKPASDAGPSTNTTEEPNTRPQPEADGHSMSAHHPSVSDISQAYPHLTPHQIDILSKHGFTNFAQQFSGTGPIQPIFENPRAANFQRSQPSTHSQRVIHSMAAKLHRHLYAYSIDNKRAAAYMSDVKNNLTGLVLPKLNRETLSAWVSLCEHATREVQLLVIHGAGGAGKSRCLQTMLLDHPDLAEDVNVITPTVNLVLDWRKKNPQIDPRRFITFEKACEREGREIVIFDDYGKLPAGYIDAYLAIKPTVELVILTGDQRQSTYHCTNRDAQTANIQTNVSHYRRYCDYYVNATHRQPRRLANPIEVHAERDEGGSVTHASIIPENCTALVPSHRSQTVLADLGRTAYTYSGCQGLTLNHVTIVLDADTPLCSPEVLYTAFSRAASTITFVNTHSDHPQFLRKLDATPYLKTLISGVREDETAGKEHPPEETVVVEPNVKTHLPVENDATFLEPKVEAMLDKDVRELWDGQEKTNLMQTQDPVVQLFPHQQAKDEALFRITIDKRIRTASVDENTKAIVGRLHAGDLLFEAYAKFMRVPAKPQAFEPELWRHCRQLALRTYLSKPKANLVQGTARQDPDFPDNAIALFNKSQWVKKLEKVGFKFKAGQTISAFKQSTVLLTTTMALYLRKKREQHQPENVFIMCEKTPSDFNDFVTNRWDFTRDSYTSDYEQYDQSQDASFLNFELRKAKHLGVPDSVTDFYRFIKTHARTFVGNLAIMRLSGEGPTFDANTECNIAYDALRFNLNEQVNACYAGDDLVRDQVCEERASWVFSQHLFALTAKPQSTRKPDFCGWRLTPYGIVKNPTQLYQSLQLALRLNKMEDVKRSYAIDYTHAYKLQDRLFEIFDEKELAAHHLTTRLLIKHGVRTAHTGDHVPMFHVTSDRLIQDPNSTTIEDSSGSRTISNLIEIHEDHFLPEAPRASAQFSTEPPRKFPKLIWLDGSPLN